MMCIMTSVCVRRVQVTIVEMKKEGNLELGQCITTTGNRIHLPQGQFDRDDGPWAPAPDLIQDWGFKVKWAFNTAELKKLAAFQGNTKRIGIELMKEVRRFIPSSPTATDDEEEEAQPRQPSRRQSHRNLTSPAKVGESQVAKNAKARRKKNMKEWQDTFVKWDNEVTAYLKTVGKDGSSEASGGSKKRKSAWDPVQEQVQTLSKQLKEAKTDLKDYKRDMDSRSQSTSEDSISKEVHEADMAGWRKLYESLNGKLVALQKDYDDYVMKHADNLQEVKSALKDSKKTILHNEELHLAAVQTADLKGFVRGMKEGMDTRSSSQNRAGTSLSPITLSLADLTQTGRNFQN